MVVVFGTAATAMVYLGAGYPYGPVFLTVAVGCFSAVAGHRKAAWSAMGALWAGHVLVAHWLYAWLPPGGDGAASWGQEGVVVAWGVATLALSGQSADTPGRPRRGHDQPMTMPELSRHSAASDGSPVTDGNGTRFQRER
ncbi:hypothetical protein SMA5143A_6391 [Streptomyces sp. MA5143a]|nr:hypothetical protein SMA5143A_6391 [Streptomyces sp. MA5143a]